MKCAFIGGPLAGAEREVHALARRCIVLDDKGREHTYTRERAAASPPAYRYVYTPEGDHR